MQVGLDVGYSATKAVAGKRRVSFPSAVGTPDKARFSLGTDERIVLLAPEHVLVGEGAISQSRFIHRREDRRWIEGDEWYALFLAAATELTAATSVELRLVTGLPVAFYDDRQEVRDRLLGTHKVQREGRRCQRVEVEDARVIPQPFGALLAATLDRQGRIVDETLASGAVGVVDVGGKTTNLLSVIELREIGRETASVNVGAWSAMRSLRRWLERECPGLELRDHQVLTALIEQHVWYYEKRVDLTAAVEEILEPLAGQVIAEATQLWNGAAGLRAVLVSGGGALLLGPYVERAFRHARVVEEPVFANAEGFWRFAERVARG
jgi:plasmid segregation protein ParM